MADAKWRSRHRTNCRQIDIAHKHGCQATELYRQNAVIWGAITTQVLRRAHGAPPEPKEEEESTPPPLRRHVRAPKHKPDF